MGSLANLAVRRRQPEIMDDPNLDGPSHQAALAGLRRLNRWSLADRTIWNAIRPVLDDLHHAATTPLSLLDLASGGGDVPIRLARRVQRSSHQLEITGCDISDQAVAFASAAAQAAKVSVDFFVHDVVTNHLPREYDIVTCSLFLHHLEAPEVVTVLRHMREAARRMVVVSDLVRSRAGYAVVYGATRVLSRSPVVHIDGPRSVEGAFQPGELRDLFAEAGMGDGLRITRQWPVRMTVAWRPPR